MVSILLNPCSLIVVPGPGALASPGKVQILDSNTARPIESETLVVDSTNLL